MAGHGLGFAPGCWSRATNWLRGEHSRLIASDMPLMIGMSDVTFFRGAFPEGGVSTQALAAIDEYPIDLVISDMAPNMCEEVGRSILCHVPGAGLDLVIWVQALGGDFLIRFSQGEGFEQYGSAEQLHQPFHEVQIRKR